jgi:hypothetical protein
VALLSGTHLTPDEMSFIRSDYFYRNYRFPGRKGETAVAVDPPKLVSIEATAVCIPIDNSEILLEAVLLAPRPRLE